MAKVQNKKVANARKPMQSIKRKNTLVPIAAQVAKNKATRAKQTAVRDQNSAGKRSTAADARRLWDYETKRH